MRGRVIEMPDERLLPVRPRLRASALAIGEREEHERVEIFLVLHDARELDRRFRIVEISLLCHVREREVMIDQPDERASLRWRKLETRRGALGEECTRLCMRTRADGPPSIVKKKREVENERLVQFFEQQAVGSQLRVLGLHDLIELVDADEGVFIRGVTMEKFVLHQTSQLAELGYVTPEKIDAMHHSQHGAHF